MEAARGYASQIRSQAEGEYSLIIKKAENDALQVQKEIQSDAAYFAKVLPQFRLHPHIFAQRRYQKVIEAIAPHLEIFFLSSNKGLRIHYNRNLKRASKKEEE